MLQDIAELIKVLKDFSSEQIGERLTSGNRQDLDPRSHSLVKRASKSVLQFPVLTSSAVSKDSLSMIVKALERNYVSLVRIVISQMDVIQLEKGEIKTDLIDRIYTKNTPEHTNFSLGNIIRGGRAGYSAFKESGPELTLEAMTVVNKLLLELNENQFNKRSLQDICMGLQESCKDEILFIKLNEINEEEFAKVNDMVQQAFANRPPSSRQNNGNPYEARLQALLSDPILNPSNTMSYDVFAQNYVAGNGSSASADKDIQSAYRAYISERDTKLSQLQAELNSIRSMHDSARTSMDTNYWKQIDYLNKRVDAMITTQRDDNTMQLKQAEYDLKHKDMNMRQQAHDAKMQNTIVGVKSFIDDREIKKTNEMAPYILNLDIQYQANGVLKTTSLLIGIKCVCHLIPAEEMGYFLGKSVKENSLVFRVIQWTTGEIQFFKDLILELDRSKAEAAGAAGGRYSAWWRTLKNYASNNKFRSLLNMKKFIPNATMVITMDEVEAIKSQYIVDLYNPKFARKAADIFFLMSFVILDEAREVAYILNEAEDSYTPYSYASIIADNRRNDGGDLSKALIAIGAGRR